MFAFARRVAGSASGRPEAEAKGNLALLALVVDGILSQVAEWQTSLADMLAQGQHQREQEACTDLCYVGAEAAGLGRVAAGNGSWRLVDGRWQTEYEGGSRVPICLPPGFTPHRPVGAGGPQSPGEAPCAECQPWEAEARAEGPSHAAFVQTIEAASILRFLSEAEWRLVRQAYRDLGGIFALGVLCGGPGQGGAVSEGSFMEEANKFVKNTIAVGLHDNDESFSSIEFDFLGGGLVRWERSGVTFWHYPGEVFADLEAWLEVFLPQTESLVKRATNLSKGFSQEQGREAWATLESEVAALRRASGGRGSPAGSEAAGDFALLAKVLEQRLLRVRGWGSALLAWRSASSAGRSGR